YPRQTVTRRGTARVLTRPPTMGSWRESGLCQRHELALVRSKRATEICSVKRKHHEKTKRKSRKMSLSFRRTDELKTKPLDQIDERKSQEDWGTRRRANQKPRISLTV